MTNETNMEIWQPPKFPTIYIPVVAEIFARMRESLIENLPSTNGIQDPNTLKFCGLLYEIAELSLNFLDVTQAPFAELFREKGAWPEAYATIESEASNALRSCVLIYDELEILVFGAVVDERVESETCTSKDIDAELIKGWCKIIYRSLRIDACLSDSCIETEFAEMAALLQIEPARLRLIMDSGLEDGGLVGLLKEIIERVAADIEQGQKMPGAQILGISEHSNG